MPDEQVGVIKIVVSRQDGDASRIYADTFVGPDEEHLERDGHRGSSIDSALRNATQWASRMLQPEGPGYARGRPGVLPTVARSGSVLREHLASDRVRGKSNDEDGRPDQER